MTLRAEQKNLSCWSGVGAKGARFDYSNDDHRLSDMLNDDYFGLCVPLLKKGDWIYLTDCEDQIMVVRVDYADRGSRTVKLSRIERLFAIPVVELKTDNPEDPGLVWRWRARAGGGHSIMNAKGEVVAVNFANKELAEQAIAIMYEKGVFVAPTGHEPTSQFVKNAAVAR